MAKETKYSIRDLKKDFPTEEACLDLVFDTLHSRSCSCGGTYRQIKGRKQYQCSKCRFQIAPTATTIFHKSDTPLSLWYHAIFIFSNAKSGISAKEMERQLGVTYKCAYRILKLIRQALKQGNDKLSGDIETDTGYFGGKHYGGKNNEQLGDVMKRKVVVQVAAERGGKIKASVTKDASADAIWNFVRENIKDNSTLLTDGSNRYKMLNRHYSIQSVNHSKGVYSKDGVHVNKIETFFSHLKRSIRGTFKSVSKEQMQTYLDAFVFHYNNRHNDKERFGVLLGALLHAAK